MTTVRELMTSPVKCVRESDAVLEAARLMAAEGVGAVPVCGEDGRIKGMLTDRDIVVRVLAEGKDPRALHTSEVVEGGVVTIGPDVEAEEIIRTMSEHAVRRLPVVDGGTLVGIVAQADVARALTNPASGELVEAVSQEE
ncbi:CBS domain-containing protein [Amycolatopsis sp. NPDC058986]|uniref:CBS domain-containing protein n=1 Tax=unclassified Amycolatopsis TaxID=2618356 RepID=UPI003671D1B0